MGESSMTEMLLHLHRKCSMIQGVWRTAACLQTGLLSSLRLTRWLSAHWWHLHRKEGISSIWQDWPFHSDSFRDGSVVGLCSFGHQKTNNKMKEKTVWSYTTYMNSYFRKYSQAASAFSICNQRTTAEDRLPQPLVQLRLQDTQWPHLVSFTKELSLFCSGKYM